jgi:hypothetical protein
MKQTLLTVSLAFLALSAFTTPARAQTAPLPFGTLVGGLSTFSNCPANSGWVPTMQCATGTMQCDASLGVDNLDFTIGYLAPSGANNGTVVALNGGNGTAPAAAVSHEVQDLQYYLANHLAVVQVAWKSAWEETQHPIPAGSYGNILNAACRPAGILHLVRYTPTFFQSGGAMCAQGFSAGSAATVYALS